MQKSAAFGVGCVIPEVVGVNNYEEWQRKIANTLDSIPAIRDLEFYEISGGRTPQEGLTAWGDSHEFIPTKGMVKFRITIPGRVQNSVAFGRKVGDIEDFTVRTYFNHRHPVSFVVCEGADVGLRNPSDALIAIREFLRKEIEKLQSFDVRLRQVGPSPFHADFFLEAGDQGEQLTEGLTVTTKEKPGYDIFHFYYNEDKLSLENALKAAFSWLIPEISMFYRVCVDEAERGVRATSTMTLAEELSHTYAARGLLAYFRRILRNKKNLLSLRLSLLQAKLMAVHELRGSEEMLSSVYADRSVRVVRPYIDSRLKYGFDEELDTAEKTLDILESQHTQEVQRATTFCASLLGVIVGALLTAWLRR